MTKSMVAVVVLSLLTWFAVLDHQEDSLEIMIKVRLVSKQKNMFSSK